MNVVPSQGITNNHNFLSNTDTTSIACVSKHMTNSELSFTFQNVTKSQISNLIKLLNDEKAVQSTDIPTKLIKEFCDSFSEFICKSINHCITEGNFIADLAS